MSAELPEVPLDDRGLAYGDGLFETVLLRHGRPLLWHWHQRRLMRGCQVLGIEPPDLTALEGLYQASAATTELEVLKLIVTRGSGGRGYACPDTARPRLLSRRTPFQPDSHRWRLGIAVRLCHLRLAHQPLLAGIKHLNRLENVLARREWEGDQIGEGLLMDAQDNLVEATAMNLFWRQGRRLWTPCLDGCGVAGTLRDALIAHGIVEEGHLKRQALFQIDALWVGNSVQGIWPVHSLLDDAGDPVHHWTAGNFDSLQNAAHALLGYPLRDAILDPFSDKESSEC